MGMKFFSWYQTHERATIALFAVVLFFAGALFAIFKLAALGYNALDLGIFHQVLANTARGDWFAMSIHPHSYFGDHVSPFLAALAPFYALVPRPETLLVLQAAAVALGIFPLAMLARPLHAPFRLTILLVYALSPILHVFMIFEFELLVFALPLLLAAIVAYEGRRYWHFLVWLLLAAMIREDVGLVLIGLGVLAWIEKRQIRWSVIPAALGLLVFFGGMALSSTVNHEQYKFLTYYQWAGESASAALGYLLTHPWMLVLKLLRLQNIFFVATLFLLTAGIPLLRSRRLLPTILVAAALMLTNVGADSITLRTHYPALLVPFLLWGLLGGFDRLGKKPPRWIERYFGSSASMLAALLLIVISGYGLFTMSPFRPQSIAALASDLKNPATRLGRALIATIPKESHVASSYALLPFFGQDSALSSMNYVFTGRRQFSSLPYSLPVNTETILFDTADYRFYAVQYPHDDEKFRDGDNRLRTLFTERGFGIDTIVDSYLLLKKGSPVGLASLYSLGTASGRKAPSNTARPLSLISIGRQDETLRASPFTTRGRSLDTLSISLTWKTQERTDTVYHLRVEYEDAKGKLRASRVYALGYGLFPTPEWPAETPVTIQHRFLVPTLPAGTYSVWIRAEAEEGYLTLDQKLTATVEQTGRSYGSDRIFLGNLSR